ncbi:MAG: TetR/AcrR family transcriptional regulator [Lachnospiraceae bacterium]|nr:TetR/AcrR family transcriptional regulator [Lachnospiraceae bacterium]
MPDNTNAKYNKILDALQALLEEKSIGTISVREIAEKAGIGKGSIYYYFSSKEAIMEALVERDYQKPLDTAKSLAGQREVSPFTRMAMIFQACRTSSMEFGIRQSSDLRTEAPEKAFIHQRYITYLIQELTPTLTEIIQQGIDGGDIHFDNPSALAEIVLIVLAVKLDNTLVPSTQEEIENTIVGLISLLENGTGNPPGSLNFLRVL